MSPPICVTIIIKTNFPDLSRRHFVVVFGVVSAELHTFDGGEVHYNIKNSGHPVSDAESMKGQNGLKKFKADFIAAHGYAPSEDYIRAAVAVEN